MSGNFIGFSSQRVQFWLVTIRESFYRLLILLMLALMISCSSDQPANHLAGEQSPYLLQHAHNPVDWYPWGEEAFERARRENKPIFLSIGYSTCHWCHVMEHESFENKEVAALLNKYFISIKVDREERPDVDRVYMSFVQATSGQGGWPLSVWLSPDLKPFAGGTYFPPEDKYGRPGFKSVLTHIARVWEEEPDQVRERSREVFHALEKMSQKAARVTSLDPAWMDQTYRRIRGEYDEAYGGFGAAPKFPRPSLFHFLLRYATGSGVPAGEAAQAREMVFHTLREMTKGGIYDQIGGGFHRYSVDKFWHVPHFEKMLYDQAQLAVSLNEAYLISGDADFAQTCDEVIGYVLRDLKSPQGGFYTAEDADSFAGVESSEKTEGAFYVWRESELREILSNEEFEVFALRYGVRKDGNIRNESDPHGELRGMNVLSVVRSIRDVLRESNAGGQSEAKVRDLLTSAKNKLWQAREQRPRPHRDDKMITAWNGLMISALAQAGASLGNEKYLKAAAGAVRFIRENLYDAGTKELYRSYRTKRGRVKGFADDYGFFIAGLLDLYEATGEVKYLVWARELQQVMDERFWDGRHGGYYQVASGESAVLIRTKEGYDGAEPSANSIAIENLIRLGDILKTEKYRQRANDVLTAFGADLKEMGYAAPRMLSGLGWLQVPPSQVVLTGPLDSPELKKLRKVVFDVFDPDRVLAYGLERGQLPEPADAFEALSLFSCKRVRAAVCRDFVCLEPTADPEKLRGVLEQK